LRDDESQPSGNRGFRQAIPAAPDLPACDASQAVLASISYFRVSPGMDRTVIIEHLALAQKHIVEGELRVRQQREYVAKLASRGEDTGLSKRILARLEAVLAMHVADCDRLIRELDGRTQSKERAALG
jgi:hypothetical protein